MGFKWHRQSYKPFSAMLIFASFMACKEFKTPGDADLVPPKSGPTISTKASPSPLIKDGLKKAIVEASPAPSDLQPTPIATAAITAIVPAVPTAPAIAFGLNSTCPTGGLGGHPLTPVSFSCAYTRTGTTTEQPVVTLSGCPEFNGTWTWNADKTTLTINGGVPISSCALEVKVVQGSASTVRSVPISALDSFVTVPDSLPGYTSMTKTYPYGAFTDLGTLYVAGEGGIQISNNNGATWTAYAGRHWKKPDRAHCVVANGSKLFVGLALGGIAQSSDGGATWASAQALGGRAITGSFDNCWGKGSSLMGLWNGEVRVSVDDGLNWVTPTGLVSLSVADATYVDANTVYVSYGATAAGLSKSTDGGRTFVAVDTSGLTGTKKIAKTSVTGTTLWVVTTDAKVARSDDGGTTWVVKHSGKTYSGFKVVGDVAFVGTTNEGLLVSRDGGATWAASSWSLADGNSGRQYVIHVITAGNFAYAVTVEGIYRSSDLGVTWPDFYTSEAAGSWISGIAKAGADLVVATWGGGISLSSDKGATWVRRTRARNSLHRDWITSVAGNAAGTIYSGTSSGLQMSVNRGASWAQLHSRYTYSVDTEGDRIATGGHLSGASISADAGITWAHFLPGVIVRNVVWVGNRLYAGTTTLGLAWTDNFGATWTYANASTPGFGEVNVSNFSVEGQRIAASTNVGIALSEDAGLTWTTKSAATGLPGTGYGTAFWQGEALYVSISNVGIAVSVDHGVTWALRTAEKNGLTANHLSWGTSFFTDSDGTFYLGSSGLSRAKVP